METIDTANEESERVRSGELSEEILEVRSKGRCGILAAICEKVSQFFASKSEVEPGRDVHMMYVGEGSTVSYLGKTCKVHTSGFHCILIDEKTSEQIFLMGPYGPYTIVTFLSGPE